MIEVDLVGFYFFLDYFFVLAYSHVCGLEVVGAAGLVRVGGHLDPVDRYAVRAYMDVGAVKVDLAYVRRVRTRVAYVGRWQIGAR